jgi:hypothetical protein
MRNIGSDCSPHHAHLELTGAILTSGLLTGRERSPRQGVYFELLNAFHGLRFARTVPSDDCAEGNSHALTCSPDSNSDRFTCSHSMRECRSLPCSRVLESDGLDPTTEKCVPLFQPIERGIQLRDNCLGLISDNDQFDIDLLV